MKILLMNWMELLSVAFILSNEMCNLSHNQIALIYTNLHKISQKRKQIKKNLIK